MSQDWNLGDPLPKAEDAEIDPRKFEEYSLNPNKSWQPKKVDGIRSNRLRCTKS